MSLWAFGESVGLRSVCESSVYGASVSPWAFIVGICRALSESEGPQHKGSRRGGGAGVAAAPPQPRSWGRKHISLPLPPPEILKGPQGKLCRKCKEQHYTSSVALRALSCTQRTLAVSGTPSVAQGAPSVTQRTILVVSGALHALRGSPLTCLEDRAIRSGEPR